MFIILVSTYNNKTLEIFQILVTGMRDQFYFIKQNTTLPQKQTTFTFYSRDDHPNHFADIGEIQSFQ